VTNQLRVMISSTGRDLPEHRKEAMDACLRQGMFPVMMEHLAASEDDAIAASLKMVNTADIYLLILAHRYGYVPDAINPPRISVTEYEYNRAVERKIPILTFAMHEDHPVKAADVEKGEGAAKLDEFKKRALLKVTNFFKSPADLRACIIDSLSDHRERDLTSFHYVSNIPLAPETYIAHPYTLLQTHTLIGRRQELNLLTDWITGKEFEFDGQQAAADSVRIMNVVAIGGMGKSALTWKWFNDLTPQKMKHFAGRMWWSFYESDATYENFVTRALAYVSHRTLDEVQNIPERERETELLAALDHQPFLFALDGLERILIAYARMDAARLDDSNLGTEKNLRKTSDLRAGNFLKKLAQLRQCRVVVSSRLYPAELETSAGDPIPGSFRIKIEGLADEDAVELWRAFGVRGSRDNVLPILNTFAKHPLLIQALAGEVKRYRNAPGSFEEWKNANQRFDPGKCARTKDAIAHVLEFAIVGLNERESSVVRTLAAFRMPAPYGSLVRLLIGNSVFGAFLGLTRGLCSDERELDIVLTELEDRGLVGWDRRSNRYDLHPIVRSAVWNMLRTHQKRGVYAKLRKHLRDVPTKDWKSITSIDDLAPSIELYNTLLELGRWNSAFKIFARYLDQVIQHRLHASLKQIELLEMLKRAPLGAGKQAYILNALALAYESSGQPLHSVLLFSLANEMSSVLANPLPGSLGEGHSNNIVVGLRNISAALLTAGVVGESERAARGALLRTRKRRTVDSDGEACALGAIARALAVRGDVPNCELAIHRISRIFGVRPQIPLLNFCPRLMLWLNKFDSIVLTAEVWANSDDIPSRINQAILIQGEAALGLNDHFAAEERLNEALARARAIQSIDIELPALVALAELRRRQGELKAARKMLDDLWEPAGRGPYPLFQTDALNVIAQIERDDGNMSAAIEAATKAYQLSWCEGPPFAYHWGLEKARQHLKELDTPVPDMLPFDESKFEPMPKVEINPRDEFYVDEGSINKGR
jgi:tetratricopeptide (TPR) repeat protein